MRLKNVYIYTLGCRLNQTESEGIGEAFKDFSFSLVQNIEEADLSIINSCTVTSKAEQKMRREINLFKKTSICIVTGCAIKESKRDGDVIYLSLSQKGKLLELPKYLREKKNLEISREDLGDFIFSFFSKDKNSLEEDNRFLFFPKHFLNHQRASLKIQDGCDRHCSFCAVSIARGKPRSLNIGMVVERFNILQSLGYKEITLTGVNLALYNDGKNKLSNVLNELKKSCDKDVKIRLSSLEPDLLDDKLLETLGNSCIAPYFHLPIQSASKRVLEATGRKYDKEDLKKIIGSLRETKPNAFIGADIIVGLPLENREEFEETYNFLKEEELSFIHIFPYSKREGTKFYGEKCINQHDRDLNCKRLKDLNFELYKNYSNKFVGKTLSAIFEEKKGDTLYFTSDNYLKIICKEKNSFNLNPGSRINIRIEKLIEQEGKIKILGFPTVSP